MFGHYRNFQPDIHNSYKYTDGLNTDRGFQDSIISDRIDSPEIIKIIIGSHVDEGCLNWKPFNTNQKYKYKNDFNSLNKMNLKSKENSFSSKKNNKHINQPLKTKK